MKMFVTKSIRKMNAGLLIAMALFLFNPAFAEPVPRKGNSPEEVSKELRQQLEKVVTEVPPAKEELIHELDSYARYMPKAGVKSMAGGVEIFETASEYSYDTKIADKLPVEFTLDTKYVGIDNSTQVKLPASLTKLAAGAEFTLPFFRLKDTYLRFYFNPSLLGSQWHFRSANFRIPMQYYIINQFNDKLIFIAGVQFEPEFEDSLWPLLGFIYKPNEKLTFNIIPENPNITYSLTKKIDIFLEGDNTDDEYVVDTGELKNKVLRYRELHYGAGLTYKMNKFIQASFSGGLVCNRFIKYRSDYGKVNIKDGPYINLRVDILV